jgi:hypothetical protein
MGGAKGRAEPVANDTRGTGVRIKKVLVTQRVSTDDALRCKHQQQQGQSQAATQCEGRQVHGARL